MGPVRQMVSDEDILTQSSAHLKSPGPTKSHLRSIAAITGKPLRTCLLDVVGTFKAIRAKYPNTNGRKSKVKAIVNALARCPAFSGNGKELAEWRAVMTEIDQISRDDADDNRVTDEDLANMIPIPDIEEALRQCENHRSLRASQFSVLGAIASYVWPKRANWNVPMVPSMDDVKPGSNALVVGSKAAVLVLCDYKTAKSYGRYEETLPDKFTQVLRRSLRAYPRSHLFLQERHGKAWTPKDLSENMFSAMTWLVGKRIGWTLLRHMWISQRITGDMTIAEQKGIAKRMLHSWDEQKRYCLIGAQFNNFELNRAPVCKSTN